MVGITRFKITDSFNGAGAQRMKDSESYWPIANKLYREIFDYLSMPLLPEEEVVECTKEEFVAGYDYQLGIDVILRSRSQGESTLQEKFLFTDYNTVTVEHCQDWLTLEKGDWFKLKAQYYFVGYDPFQLTHILKPWCLIDWTRLQRATSQNRIHWRLGSNDREKVGARASFIYLPITNLPRDVVVLSDGSLPSQQGAFRL